MGESEPTPLRTSPLHERHEALGAKFAPFAGWQMPLEYPGGTLQEHAAVREAVGVFDVSHMGKVRLVGPGAVDFANSVLSNDLGKIRAGKAQYTLLCDPETGGVIDDLIAYLVADDEVLLVPNAANAATVVDLLASAVPGSLEVRDEHEAHAILALQGRSSDEVLAGMGLPTGHEYMSFEPASWSGHSARTRVNPSKRGLT